MDSKMPSVPASPKVKTVQEKYADITLRLVEDHGYKFGPLTPETERKLRRKLYLHIMVLLSTINLMLFIDKSTLGYAAILGIFEETGISKSQYNNLNTFFYVGYLAGQIPGYYLLQRLPFGKFMSGVIFSWGVVIMLHCVATRYGGLVVVRLALGVTEAVIVPALELPIGMFFNRQEQSFLQPIIWISCVGAPIPAGFISYGLLFSQGSILPWKLFMIVIGGLTILLSIWVWFGYPSNPTEAWFLTLEEKVHVIRRVHESHQSSIEQKKFKKSQFTETLTDPVSWLFALQSFTLMYCNNLTYGQQNLLITSLGVSNLGSTLVAAAGGAFSVFLCIVATFLLRCFPKYLALHSLIWCGLALIGGICMVTINWDRKLALLASMLLAENSYGVTYIIALGWTSSSAAGYTKKLTRNGMFMLGYSVGNIISPQIWVPSAAPRYYGAWISMIVVSWAGTPAILGVIHLILTRRNSERKKWTAELSEDEREGCIEQIDEDGSVVRKKVDLAVLDLTDLENKLFVYPI